MLEHKKFIHRLFVLIAFSLLNWSFPNPAYAILPWYSSSNATPGLGFNSDATAGPGPQPITRVDYDLAFCATAAANQQGLHGSQLSQLFINSVDPSATFTDIGFDCQRTTGNAELSRLTSFRELLAMLASQGLAVYETLSSGGSVLSRNFHVAQGAFETAESLALTNISNPASTPLNQQILAGLDVNNPGAASDIKIAIVDGGVSSAMQSQLQPLRLAPFSGFHQVGNANGNVLLHGYHLYEILAGADDTFGATGTLPSADNVALITFPVDSLGDASLQDVIAGLDKAVEIQAEVILLAWSRSDHSPLLREAVNRVRASGAVLVASAGNNSSAAMRFSSNYPAAYPGVVGVAAVGCDAEVTSNRSTQGFVAWGCANVGLKTVATTGALTIDHNQNVKSGTSVAAATMAGLVANALDSAVRNNTAPSQVMRSNYVQRLLDESRKLGLGGAGSPASSLGDAVDMAEVLKRTLPAGAEMVSGGIGVTMTDGLVRDSRGRELNPVSAAYEKVLTAKNAFTKLGFSGIDSVNHNPYWGWDVRLKHCDLTTVMHPGSLVFNTQGETATLSATYDPRFNCKITTELPLVYGFFSLTAIFGWHSWSVYHYNQTFDLWFDRPITTTVVFDVDHGRYVPRETLHDYTTINTNLPFDWLNTIFSLLGITTWGNLLGISTEFRDRVIQIGKDAVREALSANMEQMLMDMGQRNILQARIDADWFNRRSGISGGDPVLRADSFGTLTDFTRDAVSGQEEYNLQMRVPAPSQYASGVVPSGPLPPAIAVTQAVDPVKQASWQYDMATGFNAMAERLRARGFFKAKTYNLNTVPSLLVGAVDLALFTPNLNSAPRFVATPGDSASYGYFEIQTPVTLVLQSFPGPLSATFPLTFRIPEGYGNLSWRKVGFDKQLGEVERAVQYELGRFVGDLERSSVDLGSISGELAQLLSLNVVSQDDIRNLIRYTIGAEWQKVLQATQPFTATLAQWQPEAYYGVITAGKKLSEGEVYLRDCNASNPIVTGCYIPWSFKACSPAEPDGKDCFDPNLFPNGRHPFGPRRPLDNFAGAGDFTTDSQSGAVVVQADLTPHIVPRQTQSNANLDSRLRQHPINPNIQYPFYVVDALVIEVGSGEDEGEVFMTVNRGRDLPFRATDQRTARVFLATHLYQLEELRTQVTRSNGAGYVDFAYRPAHGNAPITRITARSISGSEMVWGNCFAEFEIQPDHNASNGQILPPLFQRRVFVSGYEKSMVTVADTAIEEPSCFQQSSGTGAVILDPEGEYQQGGVRGRPGVGIPGFPGNR